MFEIETAPIKGLSRRFIQLGEEINSYLNVLNEVKGELSSLSGMGEICGSIESVQINMSKHYEGLNSMGEAEHKIAEEYDDTEEEIIAEIQREEHKDFMKEFDKTMLYGIWDYKRNTYNNKNERIRIAL